MSEANQNKCYQGWSKEEGNSQGRCCCNCEYQVKIMRHPWNQLVGGRMKGPVTEIAGYGCTILDHKQIIFQEVQHLMCEGHEWRITHDQN